MLYKNKKKYLNLIEKFIYEAKKPHKSHFINDAKFNIFLFFGNYRLVEAKNLFSTIYSFLIDNETALTIEKDLMGNILLENKKNINYKDFQKKIELKNFIKIIEKEK